MNLIDYKIYNGEIEDNILSAYYMAGNGMFQVVSNGIIRYNKKVNVVPELDNMEENIVDIQLKIPFDIFRQIYYFFQKVYLEKKTEATAFVMKKEDEYKKEIKQYMKDNNLKKATDGVYTFSLSVRKKKDGELSETLRVHKIGKV